MTIMLLSPFFTSPELFSALLQKFGSSSHSQKVWASSQKKNLLINFLLTYCCQRELSSVVPWSAWFGKLYITLSEIVKKIKKIKKKQKKNSYSFFLRNASLSQIFGAWLKTVLVMWKMDSVAWFSYYMTIHMSYFPPKKKTAKNLLPP